MNYKLISITALLCLLLLACSGPESPRGFSLPKGDILKGETVFMKYQCLSCHTLEGFEDESLIKEFDQTIKLGGTSSIIKTYAQLVTSVINPSHKLAPRPIKFESVENEDGTSKMRVFNDVMTVSELIDLVAFLQPKYEVKPIQYTHYGQYRVP
jgi:hypothetical protein